jgi:sulfur carrier protein ThiS
MKITLKLYATLSDYLPDEALHNAIEVEVPERTSPSHVIDRYRLPPKLTHLVLINGIFTPPAERATAVLRDGDTLAIWPPIAGG